jgi:hypothetical protein
VHIIFRLRNFAYLPRDQLPKRVKGIKEKKSGRTLEGVQDKGNHGHGNAVIGIVLFVPLSLSIITVIVNVNVILDIMVGYYRLLMRKNDDDERRRRVAVLQPLSQPSHVEWSNGQTFRDACMTAGIQGLPEGSWRLADACRGELQITFACRPKIGWQPRVTLMVGRVSRLFPCSNSTVTARSARPCSSWTLAPGVTYLLVHNNSSCAGLRPASECDDNIVPYV